MRSKQKMLEMLDTIQEMFPNAKCELNHRNEFDLLIAVLLSAQCTDKLVNKVTAVLFQKYHTPEDYVRVPLEELQTDIRSIGLYRNKSKNIQALCQTLIEKYNSEVPQEREALEALPGVGRKTANVVLSVAFGVPAIAVDTHVQRVSKRLKFCRQKDSVRQVEETLMQKIPPERWSQAHHQLIFFGRYFCKAQRPNCTECPFQNDCTTGKKTL
ncbi:MAG TPA: endonuclease III [Firmicutes bacterium]|nr:endonuclease III [Bacillota bacterium]